ncbi:MAG TPA: ATP-binding cassette domain-containing protein [Saprospiraceae bacterium]|nr:ATP-binding cassette domain-containing protein [Saprospiraceae bacterium]
MLKIDHVTKQFSNHLAVNQVSFNMPKGSIMGLLGPNGAGKTTLIRMITTITMPDSGHIYFDDEVLSRKHILQTGYMPEERGLYKKMKVGHHLVYLAQLKGFSRKEAIKEIRNWMEKFDILDWWDKKVRDLSKGMQQKIQFISTVVHRPKLLIFDEPFSGLDPINTNLIKDEIRQLHAEGASIIFSTHRMEQVEEICEYAVLINQGTNILEGYVKDIKQSFKKNHFEINYSGTIPASIFEELEVISHQDNRVVFHLSKDQNSNIILRQLIDQGIDIQSFKEILPTFNEIFINQVEKNTANL